MPARYAQTPEVLKRIKEDRLKNATRLGETAVELKIEETVAVLDVIDDEEDEQWPEDLCPPCEDIRPSIEPSKLCRVGYAWLVHSPPPCVL